MFGVTNRARGGRPEHRYYQCHGKDGVYRDRRCPRRCVPADELEAAVWQHVKGLLDDPAALLAQFEAFAREADAQETNDRAEEQKWEGRLRRLDREERRLVDAYQAEVIDLAELKGRRGQIATRRQTLAGQREQLARLRDQRRAAQGVWADLRSFCERVRGQLESATLAERQQLLQLLI
jgi:site-specific DNA recombinase